MPPKPPVEEEEEVDEEKELEQAKQLVLEKVTQAFAQKHGRDPTQQERAAIARAPPRPSSRAPRRARRRARSAARPTARRAKASAAFEKAEGRKPTQAELDVVLAVVAPEAIQTPAKAPSFEVESPTCVADVPCPNFCGRAPARAMASRWLVRSPRPPVCELQHDARDDDRQGPTCASTARRRRARRDQRPSARCRRPTRSQATPRGIFRARGEKRKKHDP